jgi:tRNA A-37 threonylcarbamoyl transferase component Bud32/TolB-like protein/tetratricopeptide (TPR) repeat protein
VAADRLELVLLTAGAMTMAADPQIDEGLRTALAHRYRIEAKVGSGGMATVYRAEDLKHHRKVAVKVLKAELAEAVGAARFLREIEVAANLMHPHILPVFDSGEADGFLYFVMPFVRGGSLRERLEEEKQLPVEEAVQIAREVADALAYAHERGIIHRDVKPANILMAGGHALLADFGVAQAVEDADAVKLTAAGTSVGTPAYMSPEQASGNLELDGRSDLYALGCVLYEMLVGQPPFTGTQVESVLRQHLTVDPSPVTQVRTTVPTEVTGALTRALAKSPADRYRTGLEFAKALAIPSPPRDTSGEHRQRTAPRRMVRGLGIVVVAAVVAGLLWIRLQSGQAPRDAVGSQRVIVLPYTNQTGNPELEPVGRMVAEWITEGLSRTGEVQVVPNLMVLESMARIQAEEAVSGGDAPVARLARETKAGIAVTGSIYQRGEEIELHSEVTELESGQPLGSIEASRGPLSDPGTAIDEVRGRVLGVLATRLNPQSGWEVPRSVQPPTFEAFQSYSRGGELWVQGRYREAAGWFTQAYEADTTFLRSLLFAGAAFGNAGDRHTLDSIFQVILPRRDALAPYDRYRLDFGMAGLRGDNAAQLRAARAAVELVPSGTLRLALVLALVDANRPAEALESLEGVWEDVLTVSPTWYRIWDLHTELHHLLGNHERELEIARQGREIASASLHILEYEGRALAALGRMEELRRVTAEIMAAPDTPGTNVGLALHGLAADLQAHGHPSESSDVVGQALRWIEGEPADYSAGPEGRELAGRLLYLDERWEEARDLFRILVDEGRRTTNTLGYLGAAEAHLDDVASAQDLSRELAELEEPYLLGVHTLWRARIDAVLGNQEDAVALFQRALGEGVGFGLWLHADADLMSLQSYEPFQALIRPRG